MTRIELANKIAALLSTRPEDYSAKVRAKGQSIKVECMVDTGGKRGWIDAGVIEITLGGAVEIDKTCAWKLGNMAKAELAEIKAMSAEPEAPAAPKAPVARVAMSEEELIVAAVADGTMSLSAAMNRDF